MQNSFSCFDPGPINGPDSPRALVTGGAGFLASHLCEKLLSAGFRVTAMDNLVTGNLANIAHLRDRPDFNFVHHDVSTHIHWTEDRLDRIYHFASPASPIDYLQLPIQTLKVGSMGTHNALGLAKATGARLLLASTSEVYGDPLVHPQIEEYWGNVNPIGPRGVYDEAKRFAEAIVMAYHRYHKVQTRIVRIFNTYGPRMRPKDGRIVPAFICEALKGEPITVFGDGTQTRSFCFVADLIEGIYRLMESDYDLPVNIGNPGEWTVMDFAEEIRRITGSSSRIVFRPLPQDDPKVRQPNISKAKEILGWEPKYKLADGLAPTIAFFKEQIAQGLA
jgi:dTDP-glucose 4,6-dehydratase